MRSIFTTKCGANEMEAMVASPSDIQKLEQYWFSKSINRKNQPKTIFATVLSSIFIKNRSIFKTELDRFYKNRKKLDWF
jgi:hypothetical protein